MVAEKASTSEVKRLNDYELTLIIKPDASEEVVNGIVETIKQFVTSRGGNIVEVTPWGKKKLAYPIKHYLEGNYILFKMQAKPSVSKDLEATLQISENIVRFLMVKIEK